MYMCMLQGGAPEGDTQKSRSATKEQQEDPLFVEFQKFDSSHRGYLSQYDVAEMMKSMGMPIALGFACNLLPVGHVY